MAKRTTNDLKKKTLQTTKDRATGTPLKSGGWNQVLRKGRWFLLHMWHPSCKNQLVLVNNNWRMRKEPDHDNDKRNYGIKQYFLLCSWIRSVKHYTYVGEILPFYSIITKVSLSVEQTCDSSSRLMFSCFPSHIKENNCLIYKLSF